MQIASINIRYGRKYQIADFDWVNLEITLHASIDEVEASTLDPMSAAAELYAQARAIVRQQARELLAQHQAVTLSALAAAEFVPESPGKATVHQTTKGNDDHEAYIEPTIAPVQQPTPTHSLPRTSEEAEARFFARYGKKIGGATWADVQRFLDIRETKPRTVTRWFAVAERVRDHPTSA